MVLSPEAARVLGCLLEKERTTPDTYPMSLNALVTACNQSTNRHPVVSYHEDIVETALDELRERGWVRRGVYPGSRVIKYRHVLDEEIKLTDAEAAILAVLLLRGPQTPGELKTRTERLHTFTDLAAIEDGLDVMVGREEPLVRRLARQPGQKEVRVRELLTLAEGADPEIDDRPALRAREGVASYDEPNPPSGAAPAAPNPAAAALEARVAELEEQVATLRAELEGIRADLGG